MRKNELLDLTGKTVVVTFTNGEQQMGLLNAFDPDHGVFTVGKFGGEFMGRNVLTCDVKGDTKSKARKTAASVTTTKATRTCSKCGLPGHNARTCTTSAKAVKETTPKKRAAKKEAAKVARTCGTCGKPGHNTRTCTVTKMVEAAKVSKNTKKVPTKKTAGKAAHTDVSVSALVDGKGGKTKKHSLPKKSGKTKKVTPDNAAQWYADALTAKFEKDGHTFGVDQGRTYDRVWKESHGSKSVHCFIDKKSGAVLKAAGWKAPAKGIRFNSVQDALKVADWSGGYLYAK